MVSANNQISMDRYQLKEIGQLIDELVKSRKWEKNFALEKLKQDWAQIVGRNIANHTAPKFIKAKRLFIEVDSPIWSTQLNYLKNQVMDTINGYYKETMVKEIFFNIKRGVSKDNKQ